MIDPNNKVDRFLMFLPGFLSWSMLLMPVWLGLLAPEAAAFLLTFILVYWMYMGWKYMINIFRGYKKYTYETSIDWYKKVQELDFNNLPNKETLPESFEKTKHFILLPTVSESYGILKGTFSAIVNSSYPIDRMLVVVGTEEIGQDTVAKSLSRLKSEFPKLPRILHFIHPKGIPGEIQGVASPNRKWAAVKAVEQLNQEGENLN